MNKRTTGTKYETAAADYLEKNGAEILSRNYRTRVGEIDLIGRAEGYLVFFEVKYRSSDRMGDPLLAVDFRKRRKILQVAKYYLFENHVDPETPVRFDCIGITEGEIRWVKNAFGG